MNKDVSTKKNQLDNFRQNYRENYIGSGYSPGLHFISLNLFFLLLAAFFFWSTTASWFVVAAWTLVSFVFANFVEYVFHRYVLHSRLGFLRSLSHMHVDEHHGFFQNGSMGIDKAKDLKAVFFPRQFNIVFIFIIVICWLIVNALVGWNAAHIFAGTAFTYILIYEWLHMLHHIPETSRIFETLPYLMKLREHHEIHHHPKYMSKVNFNITFPIIDVLFNTKMDNDSEY